MCTVPIGDNSLNLVTLLATTLSLHDEKTSVRESLMPDNRLNEFEKPDVGPITNPLALKETNWLSLH